MQPSAEAIRALQSIAKAVVETIAESGPYGAPAGLVYAALMQLGCSKVQFDGLIDLLERAGKIRRSGNVLIAVQS